MTMTTKAYQEFRAAWNARTHDQMLFWGTGEVHCTNHRVPGDKRVTAREAWNYSINRCGECFAAKFGYPLLP